jgi:hypothetical protein
MSGDTPSAEDVCDGAFTALMSRNVAADRVTPQIWVAATGQPSVPLSIAPADLVVTRYEE